MRRDRGACRVDGCRAAHNLDLHHIVHREHGGTHQVENLIVLCEAHHLAHHEGTLAISGTASNLVIRRSPPSRFKTETLINDTRKALVALGFDKREVKAAIDAARTHVGSQHLRLEQWIKLALGYCPKPTN